MPCVVSLIFFVWFKKTYLTLDRYINEKIKSYSSRRFNETKFCGYILSIQRENPIKLFLAKTWEWKQAKFGKNDYKVKVDKYYKDIHLKNFINIDEDLSSIQKELPKKSNKIKSKTNKKFSIE